MRNSLQKGKPRLKWLEIGAKRLEHHLPSVGVAGSDQLGHVEETSIMMEEELPCSLSALVDEGAVGRIGDTNAEIEKLLERAQIIAENVTEILVVHDHRRDPREHVVAGEYDSGSAVAEADVCRLVARSVHDLQGSSPADVDDVTVLHRLVRRGNGWHVVGAHHVGYLRHREVGDTVAGGDSSETLYVPGSVVVAIDELRGALMHDETTTPFFNQPGRHPDMVRVEMGDDQGMNRRFFQAESGEALSDRLTPTIPIGPTVEEKQSTVGLDGVGIDPGRAFEWEWHRNQMDPIAQG